MSGLVLFAGADADVAPILSAGVRAGGNGDAGGIVATNGRGGRLGLDNAGKVHGGKQ